MAKIIIGKPNNDSKLAPPIKNKIYNYGGEIKSVKGVRSSIEFPYVKEIGYYEYAQRVYIEYGSGVKSTYSYDPYRKLYRLSNIFNF
ncbi:MAG: hypothetical protein LBQ93_11860 [Treponema sp.]|jgi:hypothetical protein|nr:hypothetical protein [Treponema sp.]